ncbi:hypothetical protein V6N12_009534 [Hibiscus sabdariffa]|uniref:Mitochondrial import inner membrane translocase subunit TIM50 n=1 Tax=Hibiscus sabdariffa TaxID=183260 RepID=A0ABR1ZLW6_9ROSI
MIESLSTLSFLKYDKSLLASESYSDGSFLIRKQSHHPQVGLKQYASQVLDKLNPSGRFMSHRLYRDSCREVDEKFVKDLSVMGRDLGRVVIFNENPNAYSLQPENVVLIGPFVEDNEDRELEKLARFFDWCERF